MEFVSSLLVFLSLIENFLRLLIIFTLLNLSIKDIKFVLSFVIVTFIILFFRGFAVTPLSLFFLSFFVYVGILIKAYKKKVIISAITTGLVLMFYTLLESTLVPLQLLLYNVDLAVVIKSTLLRILFFLPQVLAMLITFFIIKKYGISFENYYNIIDDEEIAVMSDEEVDLTQEKRVSSTIFLASVFLIIQGLFIVTSNWSERLFAFFTGNSFFTSSLFINIMVIFLTLVLLYLLRYLVQTLVIQRNEIIKRVQEKNAQRLSWELRMQYHDYNHHLGMINMMLAMNQVDQAKRYLKGVVDELESVEEIVRSGNEALNALLYSKIARGNKREVPVEILLENPVCPMKVTDWDLNRIIGNLLDNAIEALEDIANDKSVKLTIKGGSDYNLFNVKTFGIVIDDEKEARIFERGFTSKGEEGHGLGLAICKQLVDRYDGKIYINKDEDKNYTAFVVLLPALG
ncbi:GHKL domain-containing protein [Iocasia frigidifontis]|uniref:histidine kinase n=1 Tax=Iocasia fonsfrigidae TaxID=2682810 RepID=A0A8A7K758_9FIRM|nr:ATP-binding protein [Iocasia fonsfrigidae]QTL97010.1 GHKL domain-containing protein [Iocasia fonsfrigidae]